MHRHVLTYLFSCSACKIDIKFHSCYIIQVMLTRSSRVIYAASASQDFSSVGAILTDFIWQTAFWMLSTCLNNHDATTMLSAASIYSGYVWQHCFTELRIRLPQQHQCVAGEKYWPQCWFMIKNRVSFERLTLFATVFRFKTSLGQVWTAPGLAW